MASWVILHLCLFTHLGSSIELSIQPVDSVPGTKHQLIWNTTPGEFYTLSQTPNLESWTTVPGYPKEAASTEESHSLDLSTGNHFFRVREVSIAETVTWTIGKATSSIDGGEGTGPVTFSWTFDRPVEHGTYLDGTPWVVWQDGLQLVSVTPTQSVETVPLYGGAMLTDAIVDATCINPGEARLPLDERMGDDDGAGTPWGGGTNVWDESPTLLFPGDSIVTGRGRRDGRDRNRQMLFTAIGVCNIVSSERNGHYRPPLRMPASLRASLATPSEVDVSSLPVFNFPLPTDWAGNPVTMDFSHAVSPVAPDADDLLNGPTGNCGIDSYYWYETANGMLNHDLSETDDRGYQRDVADRIATCLYTAFDPEAELDKRQRSLNKFIQVGLDYWYMHCLGYPVWNGGGGHPDGLEGTITLTGALLGDAQITEAVKYQRFPGEAVGLTGTVTDFFDGYQGTFTRTEACHLVEAADWQSGQFIKRPVGNGAATLEETVIRIDFARADMVLNNEGVPYISIADNGSASAVAVPSSFA